MPQSIVLVPGFFIGIEDGAGKQEHERNSRPYPLRKQNSEISFEILNPY